MLVVMARAVILQASKYFFYLSSISGILFLPVIFTRIISNGYIFLIRGRKGLEIKNAFVASELRKRQNAIHQSSSIRELSYELDS